MSKRSWLWFVIVQTAVLVVISLPWFFPGNGGEPLNIGIAKTLWFALAVMVIVAGIYQYIKTPKAAGRHWKTPEPVDTPDMYEWVPIPGFEDYEVNRYGEVWYVPFSRFIELRRENGTVWYELEKDGHTYTASRDTLISSAFLYETPPKTTESEQEIGKRVEGT